MEVRFTKAFEKDLKAIRDKRIVLNVDAIIIRLRTVNQLSKIPNLKMLKGYKDCYRIRIGKYRLGLMQDNEVVWLARLMDRKDIYKYFP